ncbi:MAG TPA: HNH endonuclease [Hyphomicrobiaceae bacterium]|jgi:hypothetical protein
MTTRSGRQRRRPFLQRFAEAARDADGADGCWRWTGPRNHSSGYPRIRRNGISTSVHRALMEFMLGRPLARGEQVLHRPRCRKDCVNPAHLRLGTHSENMADAKLAGRTRKRVLRPSQVRRIVIAHGMGRPLGEIARRFGVGNQAVLDIVKGRTHGRITARMIACQSARMSSRQE